MALNKLTADALQDGTLDADAIGPASITTAKLHSNIISGQTAIGSVDVSNDLLLIYDADATSLKKVPVSSVGATNTDSITEGSSNLYYTNARADARAQLKIDALVDSAPGTLDTLNELAAALGDDASFSTTVTNSIATKLPLAGGTLTGDIAHAGNLTLDVGGILNLDADTQIILKDGGANYGTFYASSSDFYIQSTTQDKDIVFYGNDNGTGIEAMRIDMSNNGAVGIGTNNPSWKFTVEGSANDDWISRIYNTNTNGGGTLIRTDATSANNKIALGVYADSSYKMVVRSTGNVGIGTSDPTPTASNYDSASLHISQVGSSSVGAQIRFSTGATGHAAGDGTFMAQWADSNFYITNQEANADIRFNAGGNSDMVVFDGQNGSVGINYSDPASTGAMLAVTGIAGSNAVFVKGNAGSGTSWGMGINAGSTSADASFRVYDKDGANSYLYVRGDGKVGIGTTNPLVKLDLGVTSPNDQVIALRQNGVSRTTLGLTNNYGVRVAGPSDASGSGSLFEVGQNNASDGTTYQNNRLTVLYDGKVGIGISGPNSLLHVNGGRLHHTDTANSSHGGASSTVYPITDVSIIGGKLRFSIQVFFQNGISNLAIRIYVAQTSLWFAGEVCIGSTYSSQQATGLNRYSFSHNQNTTNNYGNILNQTESFGQVPAQFQFASHGYDTTEGAHYFEFRHTASTGNTMWLQFEGVGSTPDHANLATWYYKHKTY